MEWHGDPNVRRFHYIAGTSKHTELGDENHDANLLSEWVAEGRTWDELEEQLVKIYFVETANGYTAHLLGVPPGGDDRAAMAAFTAFAEGKDVLWD